MSISQAFVLFVMASMVLVDKDQVYLTGEKMSGESDENFEEVTKFSPDILSPDQNFSPM